MTADADVNVRRETIEWSPSEHGGPLGRHIEHDPRSLDFQYQVRRVTTLRSVRHTRIGSLFDQGQIGSCTGNAVAGGCNTHPTFRFGDHKVLTEGDALECYKLATQIDGFPGVYPPDDTGSSGLAACKAAKQLGWIRSYNWAMGADAAIAALMVRPICIGVNWYEGFDRPDLATGMVSISGQIRGGHEFVIRQYDALAKVLWADNSWSTGWGVRGRFCFTVDTLAQLLGEGGDVVIPIR